MPKISAQQRDLRRHQILDAALVCFSENGFHQTGMADIIRQSGLSAGAVYLYFQSKDDLIEALADDRHRQEAVLNAVAQGAKEPREALRALVHAYVHWLTDPAGEQRRRVGIHGWSEALRNDRVRAHVVEGIDMPRRLIVELIARAQQQRLIRKDVSADAVARTLIAMFQGFVLQACWGEAVDVAACAATVDHMLDGLKPPAPAPTTKRSSTKARR